MPNKQSNARKEIEEISKAGQRAASLTQQLLVFSRRQILTPKELDLNAVAAEIKKMLGRLIGEDIKLVTVFEQQLWNTKADRGQIEQVLMNLVGQLTAHKPGLNVLLSSGYMDSKSQLKTIREKGYSFVQKPYTLTGLLEMVKTAINQH